MDANSYGTNLPLADQEKARMLALDLLDPNKYVNEQQICYVARAFLELSTSSNGPNCEAREFVDWMKSYLPIVYASARRIYAQEHSESIAIKG